MTKEETVEYQVVDTENGSGETKARKMNSIGKQISVSEHHAGSILEWHGVNYTVNVNGSEKTLLHTMSGEARPGEMLAVMGTSGAGKSTLLDVLSGRLESDGLKGLLTVNGKEVDRKSFRKESGYVMQSDALFPLLTVRETIQYAASLRVHNKTKQEKDKLADEIIDLLRLQNAADTIVGDEDNRGLSGGEKRRVSIGVDIVHFPSIIFLDEPTSGLDSTTALSVVDSLKTLAEVINCTVIMTVHQPSTRLFNLVDKVIFLSAGHVTYDGKTSELFNFTKTIYAEAKLGVPPIANPPEVFLDLCDELNSIDKLDILTSKITCGESSLKAINPENKGDIYANNFFVETGILLHRALTNVIRTKELFFARFGAAVFFGVMLGTLFLDSEETTTGLDHRASYFVFTIAFFYFTSLEALPIFLAEREIFQREYSRGAYRGVSYVVASGFVMFPFLLLIALVFSSISYWLVDLPNQASFFFFHVLTVFTVLVAGSAFSTMVSVLVPNPMAGQTIGSGLFAVMFLYSGNFIRRDDIPDYWIWLHYLSLFKYAYDSMIVNAFKDNVETTVDQILDNDAVLERYGVDGINRGTGIGALWGFIILFRLVFYYRLTTAFTGSRK